MRMFMVFTALSCCLAAAAAGAVDKEKSQLQIDAARASIESFAAKAKDDKDAAAVVASARGQLKKAEEAYAGGRQMFGFGGVKPEAEQDIAHYASLVELSLALGTARLEKARNAEELEKLTTQLNKVKARVKVFEERKAEVEKLRTDAAKYEATAKELAALKADKALLASQVELLTAERKQMDKAKGELAESAQKLDELKAENARLSGQVEKLTAERAALAAQLEDALKAAAREVPRQPAPVSPPPAAKEGHEPAKEVVPQPPAVR